MDDTEVVNGLDRRTQLQHHLNGLDLGDNAHAAQQLLERLARDQLHGHPVDAAVRREARLVEVHHVGVLDAPQQRALALHAPQLNIREAVALVDQLHGAARRNPPAVRHQLVVAAATLASVVLVLQDVLLVDLVHLDDNAAAAVAKQLDRGVLGTQLVGEIALVGRRSLVSMKQAPARLAPPEVENRREHHEEHHQPHGDPRRDPHHGERRREARVDDDGWRVLDLAGRDAMEDQVGVDLGLIEPVDHGPGARLVGRGDHRHHLHRLCEQFPRPPLPPAAAGRLEELRDDNVDRSGGSRGSEPRLEVLLLGGEGLLAERQRHRQRHERHLHAVRR
mmetsp:Transcript_37295/g.88243  ORF Transcript_37295/g.88243 Transcript_37295/m.88243 type:complete len:335 (-) Transcript_37295:448-1452(-)